MKMLIGIGAFSNDKTLSKGTFLKELTAYERRYITSPFMTTESHLALIFFCFSCMSVIFFSLAFWFGS